MRCEQCTACIVERSGNERFCYIGISDKNVNSTGEWGCNLHHRTIGRLIRERDESNYVSPATRQKMRNPEEYEKRLLQAEEPSYLEQAILCIGFDSKEVYRRNHKKFFRAKKNSICMKNAALIWKNLIYLGFAESKGTYFSLTEDGLKWLAQKVSVDVIKEERCGSVKKK